MKISALLYIDDRVDEQALEFAGKYLPHYLSGILKENKSIEEVYYSFPETFSGKIIYDKNAFKREGKDDTRFWKKFFSIADSDIIIKIFADSPFTDKTIISDMIELHTEYLSEFTYSENLQSGLSCEIISRELVDSLPDIDEKSLPLNQVIKANINQFDVELYYRDPDIRDKRISFRSSTGRDKRIMENIAAHAGSIPQYSELKKIIESNPELLYIAPSYIEVELSGRCDLDCIFCYRNSLRAFHGDMEPGTFGKIISGMKEFNTGYTVCFGGSGEPLMNPKFYEMAEMALSDNLVEQIIVETNGIYADASYRNFVSSSGGRVKTVFNINGLDPETYTAIHQKNYFETVFKNVIAMKEIDLPENSFFVQIMKINETEGFLDRYYDFWEANKVPIILQKQNTYLGKIEDRRYSDLSPIERVPCWHLQRDIYLLADSKVSFCKQDIDGDCSVHNINSASIAEIWFAKKQAFADDYRKKFSINPDCFSCDEWYTFNF